MTYNITPPKPLTSTVFITLLLLLTGCRKDAELCYNHEEHSFGYRLEVGIEVEATADGEVPAEVEGIAAVLYDGQMAYSRETHLPGSGGRLTTEATTRAILFYNDDTEYIIFNNMELLTQASATSTNCTRSGVEPLHPGERAVNPPDMLYACCVTDFQPERVEGWKPMAVTIQPLVYTYTVSYLMESGGQYVAEARGALAGMAGSVFLADGHTSDTSVTILYDCELTDQGAEARVNAFGIPSYPDGDPTRRYDLALELLLKNGRVLNFTFDVTDQVRSQPRGGVITVGGVSVSDEQGAGGGGGGFQPSVEGWGESTDVDLGVIS